MEHWTCSECGKYFSDADGKTEITQAQTVIPKKDVPSIEGKYSDVSKDDWFYDSVAFVSAAGIMTGMGGTNDFAPGNMLGREQLAVMLYRYAANYKHLDVTNKADISSFTDAGKVSSWARDAIEWAVGNGIITGKDKGTRIDPQGNAARCECAAMFQRFMVKYGL